MTINFQYFSIINLVGFHFGGQIHSLSYLLNSHVVACTALIVLNKSCFQ